MRLTGHEGSIYKIIDLPDSDYFLSGGGEGWIVKWSKSGVEKDGVLVAKATSQIFSLLSIPSINLLIAGCMNGQILWIDLQNNQIIKNFQLSKYAIYDMVLVGDIFYTCGADGYLTSWDPLRMKPLVSIEISQKALRKCIYYELTDDLIIGCSDGNIYNYNCSNSTVQKKIVDAHQPSVFCLAISGEKLYSGGRDAKIKAWNIADSTLNQTIDAHWFTVNDLYSIDELSLLVSCSRDKNIRVWDTATNLPVPKNWKDNHVNSVNSILYNKQHNVIISGSDDRTIILNKLS